MLQVDVDQRYTALQVLDHPWVNVRLFFFFKLQIYGYVPFSDYWKVNDIWRYFPILSQDDRMCENQHQLSVAGKIKKHFNTGPKANSTTAGVTVIAVRIIYIL